MNRKSYPSDVTDEEWEFVTPYPTLKKHDTPQHEHDLREVFNAMLDARVVPRDTTDSVRLGAVEGPITRSIKIYDLNKGGTQLPPMRITDLQSHVPGGSNVPMNEVRL